jgi:hypothetical protein
MGRIGKKIILREKTNFFRKFVFLKEKYLHGEKETFGECSSNLAFVELIFPNLINYLAGKC